MGGEGLGRNFFCGLPKQDIFMLREAAKKDLLLMAGPLRGGGLKGRAIKEKITFFNPFFPTFRRSNVPTAIKLEGGG